MVKIAPVIAFMCFVFLTACGNDIKTTYAPINIPEGVRTCAAVPAIPEVTSVAQSNKLTLDIYRAAKDCKNTVNNINQYIQEYNQIVAK